MKHTKLSFLTILYIQKISTNVILHSILNEDAWVKDQNTLQSIPNLEIKLVINLQLVVPNYKCENFNFFEHNYLQ
jgi:hypothetical protein